jgi:hypothetical protein
MEISKKHLGELSGTLSLVTPLDPDLDPLPPIVKLAI